jgi:ribosome-binding ATPase YchF (GTP1/OBG family)
MESVSHEQAEILFVSAAIESDMSEMSREDQMMFLEEMGLTESGVGRLIKAAYHMLNYITYFTVGVKEVRAWTITRGMKAPQAAGEIHSDFEKGFIRAEVMHYEDFIHYGSEAACREVGKLHVEGKEYIVQDGDIMHFRFNV